jgi:hypothetical protein
MIIISLAVLCVVSWSTGIALNSSVFENRMLTEKYLDIRDMK